MLKDRDIDGSHFGAGKHILKVVLWESVKAKARQSTRFRECLDNPVNYENARKVLVVVVVGISVYDDESYSCLDDVPHDIRKYSGVFQALYDYTFVANKGASMNYAESTPFWWRGGTNSSWAASRAP